MTELKTLKDLSLYEATKNYIKQEAIKWIKDIEKVDNLFDDSAITFIKHFFNITEEDLK